MAPWVVDPFSGGHWGPERCWGCALFDRTVLYAAGNYPAIVGPARHPLAGLEGDLWQGCPGCVWMLGDANQKKKTTKEKEKPSSQHTTETGSRCRIVTFS